MSLRAAGTAVDRNVGMPAKLPKPRADEGKQAGVAYGEEASRRIKPLFVREPGTALPHLFFSEGYTRADGVTIHPDIEGRTRMGRLDSEARRHQGVAMLGAGDEGDSGKEIDDYQGDIEEIRQQVEQDLKCGEIDDLNAADLNSHLDTMERQEEAKRDDDFPDENMDEDHTPFGTGD